MAVNKSNDKLYFDGVGDVTSLVEKIDLVSGLKGHADEQKARFIASKLGASAFDVYRRLSIEDKKNPETIKTKLLKEFCREERNREEALQAARDSQVNQQNVLRTVSYVSWGWLTHPWTRILNK